MARVERSGLQVAGELAAFIEDKALPGTGVDAAAFWKGLGDLINGKAQKNRDLLAKRTELQEKISAWHKANPGRPDPAAYKAMLQEIGYLVPEGPAFSADTANVDPEIVSISGF